MFSKIDLCSMALLKIGEKPIQSLREDSAPAQLARNLFDATADTLLTAFPWRFATEHIVLNKNTDDEFVIPGNVLRIIKCDGKIAGNKIICPSETTNILAVIKTEPEKFPDYFASLLVTKLAIEFCIPLVGDMNIFNMMSALYERDFQTAKFIDSSMSVQSDVSDFSLINTRF